MTANWFSEIEAFPSAVLAHHWPNVPNLGDMNNLPELIRNGLVPAPDVLVGGTPCQAFSVAGLRAGLDDQRGQLTLTYVDILNAIDEKRPNDEAVCVWENVPGVLSSKDNAFGCFLAALCGEDEELRPTGKRWSNAGVVFGSQRAVAWRILDAQYFGVAQRRRRVFVVASARAGFDPTKVLFESDGLRRDIKPSRKAGAETAYGAVSHSLPAQSGRLDHNAQTFVRDAHQHHNWRKGETTNTLTANLRKGVCGDTPLVTCFDSRQDPNVYGDMAGPCSASFPPNAVMVHPIHDKATRHAGKTGKGSGNGLGVGEKSDPSFTLTTGDKHAVFTTSLTPWDAQRVRVFAPEGVSPTISAGAKNSGNTTPSVLSGSTLRRLTPIECERLQGFPSNHTQVPWRKKQPQDCPDGPRYKAIGNSKAVPVIRWVGERLIKELRFR